jgi:hypothetical protein
MRLTPPLWLSCCGPDRLFDVDYCRVGCNSGAGDWCPVSGVINSPSWERGLGYRALHTRLVTSHTICLSVQTRISYVVNQKQAPRIQRRVRVPDIGRPELCIENLMLRLQTRNLSWAERSERRISILHTWPVYHPLP